MTGGVSAFINHEHNELTRLYSTHQFLLCLCLLNYLYLLYLNVPKCCQCISHQLSLEYFLHARDLIKAFIFKSHFVYMKRSSVKL